MTKKKILLLHGNRQTGELLLGRLERFRKRLAADFDLEFVAPDAPFQVVQEEESSSGQPANNHSLQLTWWERQDTTYQGLETTIELLKSPDCCNNHDIVGVMGFSQGARLVHLLLLLRDHDPGFLPTLQFAILVAGYDAPLPDNLPFREESSALKKNGIKISSLHIFGENDSLVLSEQSRALMEYYSKPREYCHTGRHFIPSKKADIEIYLQFIKEVLIQKQADQGSVAGTAERIAAIDEESAMMQSEEVQSLLAMFPDELILRSKYMQGTNEDEDDIQFQYPIEYHIKLSKQDDLAEDSSKWPIHPLTIQVTYPNRYPTEEIPKYRLIHQNTNAEFPAHQSDRVIQILEETSRLELGMPSVLSGIYGIREYLDEAETELDQSTSQDTKTDSIDDTGPTDEDIEDEDRRADGIIAPSSASQIAKMDQEGLEIAGRILKQWNLRSASASASKRKSAGGGSWNYVIGLIGKPSAGKSTFFNVATAFARGNGARVAAHPFTTIEPNTGYCYVPAPHGLCPEDDTACPSDFASTHGRTPDGRRFLPVLLKDVAGLVPGAYQGKGKGNQFLNDLTDATVLIHVVDSSGTSDAGGNKIESVDQSNHSILSPLNDLAWIRQELVEWIYSNLAAKWDGVRRRGRDRLEKMFSGYGQREAETQDLLRELEKHIHTNHQQDQCLENLSNWNQADIHLLVSTFLGARFPQTLALNKCDLPTSQSYVNSIMEALPIYGAHTGISMAAGKEMLFVEECLKTNSSHPITSGNLPPPANVWACLTSAMELREPMLVFPVVDMVSYAPLPGMSRIAAEDASLPLAGMTKCIQASGGLLPSSFSSKTGSYAVPSKDQSSKQKLRDVLIMKPGCTVEDVFLRLKNLGALSGEFVRAEGACNIGDKPRPLPKLELMTTKHRIIRIMSNKRTAWQG